MSCFYHSRRTASNFFPCSCVFLQCLISGRIVRRLLYINPVNSPLFVLRQQISRAICPTPWILHIACLFLSRKLIWHGLWPFVGCIFTDIKLLLNLGHVWYTWISQETYQRCRIFGARPYWYTLTRVGIEFCRKKLTCLCIFLVTWQQLPWTFFSSNLFVLCI